MAISIKLTGYVCDKCTLQFDSIDMFVSHYWLHLGNK